MYNVTGTFLTLLLLIYFAYVWTFVMHSRFVFMYDWALKLLLCMYVCSIKSYHTKLQFKL